MTGVLVTGATTSLGVALVRALLDDPRTTAVLATAREPLPAVFERFRDARLRYERADLTHERQLHDLMFGTARALGIEVVAHTALHRMPWPSGNQTHALDVEATHSLLLTAERQPSVKRFVFRSSSSVYRIDPHRATVLDEDAALELSPDSPQPVRDRVEADLTVCTRMGLSRLGIVVLRLAEILADGVGSQLQDYLQSKLCLRPLGFNPMLNVLSLEDAAEALKRAVFADGSGVYNIPGADTLPLSVAIKLAGKRALPLPGPLLAPLYRVRASALGMEFRYDLAYRSFHFSAVLDGARAREELGYVPRHPVAWSERPNGELWVATARP